MQQHFSFTKQSIRAVLLVTLMPLFFLIMTIIMSSMLFAIISTMIMPVSYTAFAVGHGVLSLPFLLFILFLLNKIRRRHTLAVTLDDVGIWYEHTGKADGLVAWSHIDNVKDNVVFRRSHLLDESGNTLLKIDYFLQDFPQLNDIIAEKIYTEPQSPRQTFAKTANYQWIYAGIITLFLVTAIFDDWDDRLFSLLIIAVFLWGYVTTVSKITLADKHFVLGLPWREKIIPFTEITDIKTTFLPGSGFFQIGIFVKDRAKPHYLTKLGIDDRELLMILRQAAGIK